MMRLMKADQSVSICRICFISILSASGKIEHRLNGGGSAAPIICFDPSPQFNPCSISDDLSAATSAVVAAGGSATDAPAAAAGWLLTCTAPACDELRRPRKYHAPAPPGISSASTPVTIGKTAARAVHR